MLNVPCRLISAAYQRQLHNTAQRMVKVVPVKALEDNYMYVVYDEKSKVGFAVDPVEPEKIKKAAESMSVSIGGALVTHHHWDHAGGMKAFKEFWPSSEIHVYGGDERIDCLSNPVKHEEKFTLSGLHVTSLSTPCHTKGHICYHVTNDGDNNGVVLTGDTLFIAGCGKFFEGTAEQMQRNLNEVLSSLPDETRVYPGHEYTASNLKFATHIEPSNQDVKDSLHWALDCGKKGEPTVPSTIAKEKKINPFMRVHVGEIQKKVGATDPVEVMNKLRDAKNSFKASL